MGSKETYTNLVKEFYTVVRSKTGTLTVDNLNETLNRHFAFNFSKKFVQKICLFGDKDRDGHISFREFIDIICMINSNYVFEKTVKFECKQSKHVYYKIDYDWATENHKYFCSSGNG